MSWLFSQALVAEFSAGTSLDGELSAPSNGPPTQLAYLSHGKTTAFSRLSRFGMTCKPLTDAHGEELLKSYLAAFHARTYPSQVPVQELKASALECGSTWPELSVMFCLTESKWKTAHCLWEEDLPWSSVTLPRWGMTRNGFVFQHPTAERPISATVCGLLPTPNAMPATNDLNFCCSGDGREKPNKLGWAVAKALMPTPVADDTGHRKTKYAQGGTPLSMVAGGQLNPEWVEWLMGWPLGWTDLKPLAMDRFREWQQQHSPCCPESREAA
jgi:hypothetical protein